MIGEDMDCSATQLAGQYTNLSEIQAQKKTLFPIQRQKR